ncbi:unnamed protein product [Miscanthus lutarioriparius]|uniref:Uncharacterized protein n=1 Tax=Miscanthus lutarioriparius TaxID=422564 RepID=A0A811S824_9POAL|nr:unnamed protein product [Miscanthus lutarioriparius]
MAGPDPSDRQPAPDGARRLPWTTVVILVVLAGNFVLSVRRVRDNRGALAFIIGLSHLNLLALFYATRRFQLSPPGSVAQGRARLAVWLLTTTLTAGFTWKLGTMLPLGFMILAWVMAAATVLGGFHLMFVHGHK